MVQLPGVELIPADLGAGHMLLPSGDRVTSGDAADLKDQFPELFHRLFHRQIGEDLGGPARGRHRHHTPLDAVVHGVFLPGLEEVASGQIDPVEFAGVQPGVGLGVSGVDGQCAAAVGVLGIVQVAAQFVGLGAGQIRLRPQLHLDAGEFFVLIADDDLLGAGLVAARAQAWANSGMVTGQRMMKF